MRTKSLIIILISATQLLIAQTWTKHVLSPRTSTTSTDAGDIDNDGDVDILSASGYIYWYPNDRFLLPDFKEQRLIYDGSYSARAGRLVDIDNDNDLDIVASLFSRLVWFENHGSGIFSSEKLIAQLNPVVFDIAVPIADFNGDTYPDIVFGSKVFLNNQNGTFATGLPLILGDVVLPFDFDKDGDVDIITHKASHINLLENLNGTGSFSSPQLIAPLDVIGFTMDLDSGDINGDNIPDLVITGGQGIYFYIDTSGNGDYDLFLNSNFNTYDWEKTLVYDFDDDGKSEIVIGGYNALRYYRNLSPGYSNFPLGFIIGAGVAGSLFAADIGFFHSVVASGPGGIVWYDITSGTTVPEINIVTSSFGSQIILADMNLDGREDILTSSGSIVSWLETRIDKDYLPNLIAILNDDFFSNDYKAMDVGDINGDNYPDIAAVLQSGGGLVVIESTSSGDYQQVRTVWDFGNDVSGNTINPRSVDLFDLDGDGDNDLLVSGFPNSTYDNVWFKNMNGLGNFAAPDASNLQSTGWWSLYPVDIDNDNDIDLITDYDGYSNVIRIALNNGQGIYQDVIYSTFPSRYITTVDLNGDGFLDIVSSTQTDSIFWVACYPLLDSLGPSTIIDPVISNPNQFPIYFLGVDIDMDGDNDIVSSMYYGDDIVWYENLDGLGHFGPETLLANIDGPSVLVSKDMDGDGDEDILCLEQIESIWWLENPMLEPTTISGTILTEAGIPVPRVTVTLTGNDNQARITGLDGNYSFTAPRGGSYTVTPSKSNDLITNNGITSLDVLLTRRHILGTPFNSPYKIIAADADASNSVSTLDILLMRAIILQSVNTFPNGRLWSFLPSDHVFADALNPFPFPLSKSYTNLQIPSDNQNFIGIKLGDVNDSWDATIP